MMAVGVSSGRPWKQGAWVTPAWPMVGAPPSQWGLCLPETPRCGLPPALACSPPLHPRELPVSLEEGVGCYRAQPCQPCWPHQRHLPHAPGVSLRALLHASALGERSHSKAQARPAAIH